MHAGCWRDSSWAAGPMCLVETPWGVGLTPRQVGMLVGRDRGIQGCGAALLARGTSPPMPGACIRSWLQGSGLTFSSLLSEGGGSPGQEGKCPAGAEPQLH